jgi:transmembrane sensor
VGSSFDKKSGSTSTSRHPAAVVEAAQWLVTLSDPECTHEERQEFVAWLRRSNLHVEEFLRISELTKGLAECAAWPDDSVPDVIARARTANLDAVTRITPSNEGSGDPRNIPTRGKSRAHVALAASLVVGFLVIGVIAGMLEWVSKTYATNAGEMRSITLEDGSVVELNTRSKLRARFTANERRVQLLSGEAIFKVAKNPRRPFRVSAGSTDIVAVGTAFNVDAHSSRTVVTVLEGRVRVTANIHSAATAPRPSPSQNDLLVELARGEQAVVAEHHAPVRVALADTNRVTAWTERRLIFERTTLADVAAEFARYNDREIRIVGDALAAKRITGVFNATDQASFIEFLRTHGDVRVREDTRGWVLEPGAAATDSGGVM